MKWNVGLPRKGAHCSYHTVLPCISGVLWVFLGFQTASILHFFHRTASFFIVPRVSKRTSYCENSLYAKNRTLQTHSHVLDLTVWRIAFIKQNLPPKWIVVVEANQLLVTLGAVKSFLKLYVVWTNNGLTKKKKKGTHRCLDFQNMTRFMITVHSYCMQKYALSLPSI